jgi:flagellar hook protein FlgE
MTHQKAMDNIGNNLANVNTVGFKKGVYQFATILHQSLRGGMGADAGSGRGSINPISMGLGAVTGSINKYFGQGPIETTGNNTDMAINGNGFFVIREGNGYAYTRDGSFYLGEDGSLLAGDGLFVQGTLAVKGGNGMYRIPQDAKMQNIVIPIGQIGGHVQTTQVEFTGNLDSRQELAYGTRLFGSSGFPTVGSLQSWMWEDFDGGDSARKPDVDETWNALQSESFALSEDTAARYGAAASSCP